MKIYIFFYIFIITHFIYSSVSITSYDTSFYPVNNTIVFYYYKLHNNEVVKDKIDNKNLALTEHDKYGKTFDVKNIKIEKTDKEQTAGNFLFLVDNSLSMYFYNPDKVIESKFFINNIMKFVTDKNDIEYLNRYYVKRDDKYILSTDNYLIKNNIAAIVNKYCDYKILNRNEAVISALKIFINNMDDGFDNKSLFSFNRNITAHTDFTKSNSSIIEGINKIEKPDQDVGWTELYEALSDSASKLVSKGGRRFLILLSDGAQRTDSDENKLIYLENAKRVILENNIVVFCIGLGNEIDDKLLSELALLSGGFYIKANDDNLVKDAYEKVNDILKGEVKVTYSSGSFKKGSRTLKLKDGSENTEKEIIIKQYIGNPAVPFFYFSLIFLVIGILLFVMIYFVIIRKVSDNKFIDLRTGKDMKENSDTILLSNKAANTDTKIIKKDNDYLLTGEFTMLNNHKIKDTVVLKHGDIVTTNDGTKILFTGDD